MERFHRAHWISEFFLKTIPENLTSLGHILERIDQKPIPRSTHHFLRDNWLSHLFRYPTWLLLAFDCGTLAINSSY